MNRIEEKRVAYARHQNNQDEAVTRNPHEGTRGRGTGNQGGAIDHNAIQGRNVQQGANLAELQIRAGDSSRKVSQAEQKLRTAYQNLQNAKDAYEAFAPSKDMLAWKAKRDAAEIVLNDLNAKGTMVGYNEAMATLQVATKAYNEANNRRQTIIENNRAKAEDLTSKVRNAQRAVETQRNEYNDAIKEHRSLWVEIRDISQTQGNPEGMVKLVNQLKSEVERHQGLLDLNEKILAVGGKSSITTVASIMAIFVLIMAAVLYATNNLSQLSFLNGLNR